MFGIGGLSRTIAFLHVTLALTSHAVVGDLFTSINDMQALAQQEQRLMKTLYDYVSTQQAKLSLLNTKLEQLAKVWPPDRSIEELIGDPINAYTLVRRLTREWPFILNLMMQNVGIQEELSWLPKEDAFVSAMTGLTRLQDVYKLDTRRLAQASWGHDHLTALDCFEIGKHLFKMEKYKVAESWFKEALKKSTNKDIKVGEDKILLHLFLAAHHSVTEIHKKEYDYGCKNGTSSVGAKNVLQYLMSQYPNYTLDNESAPLFRQAISAKCPRKVKLNKTVAHDDDAYLDRIYSKACRGIGIKYSSELRCYYIHYNNPRLIIAPFKMEEHNLNPPILMFHDVISEQETNEMKAAFNKVRGHCATFRGEGRLKHINNYRNCDVGWVEDDATAASARLSRRIGDMTNLAMETSEDNQVASYSLGGEYKMHYDVPKNLSREAGSRIATLLFYMSDVESGGYTVFPLVKVAVKPMKGSAVFWFNLDKRSMLVKSLKHGGCAVLRGSKWVLNKWIRISKQSREMFCPANEPFPRPRYYLNGVK